MQRKLNLAIKFRESFRPFAPAVAVEHVAEHFDLGSPSPYMLLVAPVRGFEPPAARRRPAGTRGGCRASAPRCRP